MDERYLQYTRPGLILLAIILAIKTILVWVLIGSEIIPLGPDEAQYWTWSERLSYGYYSKPPGIAYQIAAGTYLFGNTEFGVRFVSSIFGILTPLLIYLIAFKSGLDEEKAFYAGLIWAFSPLGWTGSYLAITDVGMIFFLALATLLLVENRSLLWVGAAVALGALFKWPIYLFWIFVPFYRKINTLFFGGIAVSLIGLLPSFFWNALHDWVTFRHVEATLPGGTTAVKSVPNPFEFLGSQVALFSPIFFILLVGTLLKRENYRFFKAAAFLPLVIGLTCSFFTKIQGNWVIMAYPFAAILVAAFYSKRWIQAGLVLSLVLIGASYFLPLRISPYKQNIGSSKLFYLIEAAGYNPDKQFLFADSYQTASLLSFYSPQQKIAYFLNLQNKRLNQFSFFPSMRELEKGKDGIFVAIEKNPSPEFIQNTLSNLKPYFGGLRYLGSSPLAPGKEALFFACYLYNGDEPKAGEQY